ncbi:hypothetical protein [Nocardia sp. NPDC056000]|uniref:hypothetical protein n=1 Tax=Nocardia sp. NPDC056000 TaxID=3345674 RepID=UPI0035DD9528
MELIFADRFERYLEPWREMFGESDGIEYRLGAMPDVGFGSDAILMAAFLAHDRYGGRAVHGKAQVLENLRGDGLPDLILATPLYSPIVDEVTDLEITGSNISDMFTQCFEEVSQFNRANNVIAIKRLLVLVSALGFETIPPAVVARSFYRASKLFPALWID